MRYKTYRLDLVLSNPDVNRWTPPVAIFASRSPAARLGFHMGFENSSFYPLAHGSYAEGMKSIRLITGAGAMALIVAGCAEEPTDSSSDAELFETENHLPPGAEMWDEWQVPGDSVGVGSAFPSDMSTEAYLQITGEPYAVLQDLWDQAESKGYDSRLTSQVDMCVGELSDQMHCESISRHPENGDEVTISLTVEEAIDHDPPSQPMSWVEIQFTDADVLDEWAQEDERFQEEWEEEFGDELDEAEVFPDFFEMGEELPDLQPPAPVQPVEVDPQWLDPTETHHLITLDEVPDSVELLAPSFGSTKAGFFGVFAPTEDPETAAEDLDELAGTASSQMNHHTDTDDFGDYEVSTSGYNETAGGCASTVTTVNDQNGDDFLRLTIGCD